MSALREFRLLVDPPGPGPWNMAVDEVLLDWAARQGGCCWRIYGWEVPTVSLGYFQAYEDRWQHAASRNCPAVRRLTGGGAIVHDAEVTYSVVIARGHSWAAQRDLLYQTVHASLIDVLADWGVAAAICQGPPRHHDAAEPFLCFQRRAPGDAIVGDIKIAGSAQRRHQGAVLQHGSVLLRRSSAAPELAALEDVAGTAVSAELLTEAWLKELSSRLGLRWQKAPLTDGERAQAAMLAKDRYGAAAWTEGRRR